MADELAFLQSLTVAKPAEKLDQLSATQQQLINQLANYIQFAQSNEYMKFKNQSLVNELLQRWQTILVQQVRLVLSETPNIDLSMMVNEALQTDLQQLEEPFNQLFNGKGV